MKICISAEVTFCDDEVEWHEDKAEAARILPVNWFVGYLYLYFLCSHISREIGFKVIVALVLVIFKQVTVNRLL